MQKKVIGITGIDTDVGKTVVSAIMVRAMEADYWKPIQAGELSALDSSLVKRYNQEAVIFPERYLLNEPMSPHAAAQLDGVSIELSDFELPDTDNHLLIEGAGGTMVPLNNMGLLITDVLETLADGVVLVSKHYLGSINHTLLSVQYLQSRNINILGIIFVGEEHPTTESIITSITNIEVLGRIPWSQDINDGFILAQAKIIREKLQSLNWL